MDNHDPQTSRATAPYSTLAALLGVSGPLRLLPQGPAPKPHIVLKRDYSKDDNNAGELSASTVRFSFIAGKKFSISKGQPLLFAVASPDDPDGKTLLSDVNAFLLEGDIVDDTEEREQELTGRSEIESLKSSKRINIDSLPPRMRKSVASKKAYASYSENEPFNSEYPSSALESAPRAYRSTEVQTDPTPIAKPHEIPSPHLIPLPITQHPDQSPTQLPSPVSADHAREVIPDALVPFDGADVDDYARSDRSRSLSPMDLSSENCTPANTLMPLPSTLPEGSVDDMPLESLLMQTPPPLPPLAIPQSMDDSEVASAVPESVPALASSVAVPSVSLPQVLTPILSGASVLAAGANDMESLDEPKVDSVATAVESGQTDPVENAEVRPREPSSVDKPYSNLFMQAEEKAPTAEVVPSPKSPRLEPRAQTREAGNIPSAPRAMTQTPRVAPQLSEMHEEVPSQPSYQSPAPAPTLVKKTTSRAMLSAPTFVKSARSSIQGTWDATPSAPYIPTPTAGNPLGIRPSSSLPPIQKPIPTAPRSLSVATAAKKPVVVGAKWSAARNSGMSVANASSNGGVSASSSSSSISSSSTIPTSPIISTDTTPPVTKTDLSQILRYSSPSPPPQPLTEPPPSPPPHPAPSKWKRVNSNDENLPNLNIGAVGPVPERIVEMESVSLKRPHELSTNSSGYTTQSIGAGSEDEHISKKYKITDSSSPPPLKSTISAPLVIRVKPLASIQSQSPSILSPATSSSTVSHATSSYTKPQPAPEPIKVTIPVPKGRAPLTHPLPPKPVIIPSGSSYRPQVKRDQKQKQHSEDAKRAAPRTDWPSTTPNAEYRLFHSLTEREPSVRKILFNGDGTQVAFICADRSLRIWDNKPSAAAEVARLTHNSQIASACWLEGPPAVMTMCMDGSLSTWTRSIGNEWKFARLFMVPDARGADSPFCMAYAKDRIAVSMPSAVKVWLLTSGTWQPQRDIVRSGVTALKFVQDGNALIGGCRDGVLWYSEVPNGTLRMHAFLSQKPIISIDIHPTGTYLLVAQEGGKAHLVTMRPNENKGNIERTYTSEKIQSMSQKAFPAVFATKGQAVLYGTVNGCALVWDRKKGTIVYGLKHPEGDPVQAAATFDGRPGMEGWMITGTKQGRLFWWPVPVAAAPSHSASGGGTPDDSERKRQKVAS